MLQSSTHHPRRHPPGLARPHAAGWLALCVLCAMGLLQACGGGSGTAEVQTQQPAPALAVSQPGELAAYVQNTLRKRLAQGAAAGTVSLAGSLLAAAPAATASNDAQRSGTLVQEAGVDEADLLFSQGQQLYTLQPGDAATMSLRVYRRDSVGVAQALQTLALPAYAAGLTPEGLLRAEDGSALVALSRSWAPLSTDGRCADACPTGLVAPPAFFRLSFAVQRVALAADGTASPGEHLSIDGRLVDSRRIGNRLYVVSTHTPATPVDALPTTASTADREAALAQVLSTPLLPRLRRNGGPSQPLLADTDCYVQKDNASLAVELTTLTVVDLASPTLASRSRCFVGGAEALYMSATQLVLATTRWAYSSGPGVAALIFAADMQTDIHSFALQGNSVDYRGSAAVPGHLGWDSEKKPLRISEHQGHLRVLTYTGDQGWAQPADASSGKPASPARLTVLREDAGTQRLLQVATLPNAARPAPLGKAGEQVYGVRFAGERAYVVTFRRTDPLYVLDLSNPADPKTVGALELAGFSEHLFPLPGGLLLGVGRSADDAGRVTGLQVALFNVQDASAPRLVSQQQLGGPGSQSALDASRHGLNLLQVGDVARLALPVALVDASYSQWTTGLLRFEVDTRTAQLVARPLLGSHAGVYSGGTSWDRSLQIGQQVYHLRAGELRSFDW